MKFLKRGFAFNKLAKGFSSIYLMINELEVKLKDDFVLDYSEFHQELYVIAYLCRKEILDRMEEYNWGMHFLISSPMISRSRITLTLAYQQTIGKVYTISEELGISERINEILEKGDAYYTVDKALPSHVKKML